MSDNGTDGRGKPCPGGAGGKFVPRVWECRKNRPNFTMLYIDTDHIEITSRNCSNYKLHASGSTAEF